MIILFYIYHLALNSEDSVRKIAKDLEIHEKTFYGWLSDYRKKHNLEILHPTSKKSFSIANIEEENRRLRKENAWLKKEKEILKKAEVHFILFSIKLMCKVFKVSRSCYYRWLSIEKQEDKKLNNLIKNIFEISNSTYGTRRIKQQLVKDYGLIVSHRRIIKIMKN